MRAIAYRRHGGLEVLEELEVEEPTARRGEVLVEVEAVGLNPLDARIRRGQLGPLTALSSPRVVGSDFAGRVLALGPGVLDLTPGERVFGMAFQPTRGSAAERIAVKRAHLSRSPDRLSDLDAATVPLAGLTALQAFSSYAPLAPGQRVLVNGASGGVGTYAAQLAAHAGARVTAVTSHRNVGWMAELGAAEVVDYTEQDFAALGVTYDCVFDCYGNRGFPETRKALAPSGVYITTIPAPKTYRWSLGNPLRRQKSYVVLVRSRSADLELLARSIDAGELEARVCERFERGDYRQAYALLESKRAKGKIALRIGSG